MRTAAASAVVLLTALLAACGDRPGNESTAQWKVDKESISFQPGSPQLAQIRTAPVEPRREAVLRFNGRLIWDEDRTVRIFSPFAGRVQSIAARAGDAVRAGQTLAQLAAPELGQVQADARKAEQDHVLAQKSLARVEELHAAGVAPAKDLQAAQADFERSAAERARTLERLKLYGAAAGTVDQRFAIRTPISGVVVERNLNPGQELRPDAQGDKALFVVSDPAHLWFVLDVAEADIGVLRPGVEVQLASTSLAEKRVAGRIAHIADQVDPQTRTVKVRGAVANADRSLKAEMFVTAELKTPTARGLLVPAQAVFLRGERYFAFVQSGETRFERRGVTLGPATDGHQVVLAGLGEHDRVVTDGALLIERILAAKD